MVHSSSGFLDNTGCSVFLLMPVTSVPCTDHVTVKYGRGRFQSFLSQIGMQELTTLVICTHYHLTPSLRCARVLSHSVVSDSLQSYGLYPSRLLSPWDSPGRNTGVGCAISSSKGSFWPKDQTCISCTGRQIRLSLSHLGGPSLRSQPQNKRALEAMLVLIN